MTTRSDVRYMGNTIYRCGQLGIGRCQGNGWHIQTYHSPTGIPWSEQECPLYATLADAKSSIREYAREMTAAS